jgi:hypothetical protein
MLKFISTKTSKPSYTGVFNLFTNDLSTDITNNYFTIGYKYKNNKSTIVHFTIVYTEGFYSLYFYLKNKDRK